MKTKNPFDTFGQGRPKEMKEIREIGEIYLLHFPYFLFIS
jgi:hypothetical protein